MCAVILFNLFTIILYNKRALISRAKARTIIAIYNYNFYYYIV